MGTRYEQAQVDMAVRARIAGIQVPGVVTHNRDGLMLIHLLLMLLPSDARKRVGSKFGNENAQIGMMAGEQLPAFVRPIQRHKPIRQQYETFRGVVWGINPHLPEVIIRRDTALQVMLNYDLAWGFAVEYETVNLFHLPHDIQVWLDVGGLRWLVAEDRAYQAEYGNSAGYATWDNAGLIRAYNRQTDQY